ncbi:hypothetical protein [Paenibacillus sp. S02]|uniref:hypothetical protein n=1 Tax=Paenibacillus sp. S02 TaxID=2823904 RepID=UPI001C648E0B|nr:hypothetical protein [Paenibacillus sp. S02]QYK65594.1 hypothetical protein KAI36_00727 [Paenibacillus sp. S02]
MKFNSDSQGITKFIHALEDIQAQFEYKPQDFFILLEPTGGHYSYLVVRVLLDRGYSIYQVENKAVKDFRERQLGLMKNPMKLMLESWPIWDGTKPFILIRVRCV